MSDSIKVLIEIPQGSNVKYELDEETGELCVDRIVPTATWYPINYGLIKETRGEDGDALDALVFLSQNIVPGVVVKCKIIGVLEMEDEEGMDHKLVCVPAKAKIDAVCGAWESMDDVPAARLAQIKQFFEHYKDLEPNKWVKIHGWQGPERAQEILAAAINRFEAESKDED